MKKFLLVLIISMVFTFVGCNITTSGRDRATDASKENALLSTTTVPTPSVSYFQERRTIAKWTQRFDKPNVITYVYLFVWNDCVGYYVVDGKPASTRSYLTPEDEYEYHTNGGIAVTAPDIDGCWGDNNPGIRFFTTEGVAAEAAGNGISYIYSDCPLTVGKFKDAPLLGKK